MSGFYQTLQEIIGEFLWGAPAYMVGRVPIRSPVPALPIMLINKPAHWFLVEFDKIGYI